MWFGWGGELAEDDAVDASEPKLAEREGVSYATIVLNSRLFEGYYNGYANDTLWPVFHYFVRDVRFQAEHHAAYQRINQLFAERLRPLLRDDDIVWVHDYHLIPLARQLHALGWRQPIGFFLHIPFPHIEMLRVLPTHAELLRDLLSYDVVGFHTQNDLRAFQSGVQYLDGHGVVADDDTISHAGKRVQGGVYPIGVDVDAVRTEAEQASSTDPVMKMVESLGDKRLMIGVDRLDYSKGLVERFAAYEQFLVSHPEELGRITYLQIAPLSRQHVRAYIEIRRTLEQAAGRTNGRFADADWTPIRYLNRNFPHATLMGFLRAAQVALVTPLRDGMNLVAKEFVAAQEDRDPGVLILSTLAGAAHELSGALLVNPYDALAVSRAIHDALVMPLAERQRRHQSMLATLRLHDIRSWTQRFVGALESCTARSV
jgi:trehalose 6-phosphate synthase